MRFNQGLGRLLAATVWLVLAGCSTMGSNDVASSLQQADRAMGATQLKSLRYAASGSGATFGQAYLPGAAWPGINVPSFVRVIDYDNSAMREDATRTRAEAMGGGPLPLLGTGEQRTTALVREGFAWNLAGPAPSAAPVALQGRVHDLWTTPHGVIKAAQRNQATASTRMVEGRSLTAIAFTEPGRYAATALINAEGLVEQVDSVVPNPVSGDTAVQTWYSSYKDFGGVKFPMRIRQSQGGFPVLDLQVSEVLVNPPVTIDLPELVRTAGERVTVEPAAPGVWFLAGGSHNSVAIEMADHLILVESPLYDGRALAVWEQASKLVVGKPVRYVVNSHHHFDHAGGLRAAAAQGATLVVSDLALPYYERTLSNPNRISADALQQSGRKPVLSGVAGKRVFADSRRQVELHYIEGSIHSRGFMMVYLPADKLLIEADAYTPGPPNAPTPAVVNANNLNLLQNIERLNRQVERILPLHGRMVPMAELLTAVGRKP